MITILVKKYFPSPTPQYSSEAFKSELIEKERQAYIDAALKGCDIKNSIKSEIEYKAYNGQLNENSNEEFFMNPPSSPSTSKLRLVLLKEVIRWASYTDHPVNGKSEALEFYCFDAKGRLETHSFYNGMGKENKDVPQISFNAAYNVDGTIDSDTIEFRTTNPGQMKEFSLENLPQPRFKTGSEIINSLQAEEKNLPESPL